MGLNGRQPHMGSSAATHGLLARIAGRSDSRLNAAKTVTVPIPTHRWVHAARLILSRCVPPSHRVGLGAYFHHLRCARSPSPLWLLQSGTATATITIRDSPVAFSFELEGVGEAQDRGFDTLRLYLDGNQVGSAEAPGGKQGCTDGPAIFTQTIALPVCFQAFSRHTFQLVADTVDGAYHVTSYYQAKLALTRVPSC